MPPTQGLPQIYRKDPPYILSVDYQDAIRGQGYIELYAGKISKKNEIDETYASGTDEVDGSTDTNDIYCQTFTACTTSGLSKEWLKSIWLYMKKGIVGGSYVDLWIEETTGGEPNGTKLTNKVRVNSGALDWKEFVFNETAELISGEVYAIVFYIHATLAGNKVIVFYDDTAPTYAGGSYGASTDAGANWTMDTTNDFQFKVDVYSINPYILFPQVFHSISESHGAAALFEQPLAYPGYEKMTWVDFDMEVGKTFNMYGSGWVEISILTDDDSIANDHYYVKAILSKVNGSTITEIASGSSDVAEFADTSTKSRLSMFIDIPKTTVNKGHTLRLTIEMYTEGDTGDFGSLSFYHDPNNRQSYTVNYGKPTANQEVSQYSESTQLKLLIPILTP